MMTSLVIPLHSWFPLVRSYPPGWSVCVLYLCSSFHTYRTSPTPSLLCPVPATPRTKRPVPFSKAAYLSDE